MALYIEKITKGKDNNLMVIFRGGGKFVWRPHKVELEKLLFEIFKIEEDKDIKE